MALVKQHKYTNFYRKMMMSNVNSNSSNNSATSSETSEAFSVEENNPETSTKAIHNNNLKTRVFNNWKRMKDLANDKEGGDSSKRPPWRAVSLSTLPKPDKNALLRAKLLDASRRLRAGKASVAVQTDIVPTKLMKEVNIGAQNDLIVQKEVGVLTDGSYVKKRNGSTNEYILTYSISQMTDKLKYTDVETQTLLPKVNTKELLSRRRSFSSPNIKSTVSSWHFDYDPIHIDSDQQFIPYTIEAGKPWCSFLPMPFHLVGNGLIGKQNINWYVLLNSIDDLVYESNSLMDTLEQVMEERRQRQKDMSKHIHMIPDFKLKTYVPPSQQWLPIIEQQERELEILVKNSNHKTQ